MRAFTKKMMNRGVLSLGVVAAVVGLGLGGCSSADRMGRYTVRVSLAESMRDSVSNVYRSVEVDLVGVNAAEKSRLDGVDLDQYFSPGSATRENVQFRKMLTFTNENPSPKNLMVTDPAWNSWLGSNVKRNDGGIGATHLYIIAKMAKPLGASPDPRRWALPLSTTKWNNGQQIEIEISPDGLKVLTAMKVKKE